MDLNAIGFFVFGAIAVLASLGVIGQRNPMHSVMLLIVSFGALAGLYILLDAPFSAVTQIIIYAGAIMVLFLFVVMLLNAHTEADSIPAVLGPRGMQIGAVLSILLAGEVVWGLSRLGLTWFGNDPATIANVSSVSRIGLAIFTTHAFAFEVTSILILVSMVGAVVIARREH
ncbi:MAG TPA: NADH-quinone oxidoreductase subunit J [Vicinamibacterales bacterium]|nr:NADH-quinone oxidoreductase subunit J [Vicinamibacterales bacterium]